MLHQDVKAIRDDETQPEKVRAMAKILADQYLYPVDFQVLDLEGKLYSQGEANRMLKPYLEVLEKGLEEPPPTSRR